ncbi:MAG: SEC-C metal-binding domain-containing protein [Acidobacteriota bacterium]
MKTHVNDPCPCGSGKKYKKCCMDKETNSNQIIDIQTKLKDDLISVGEIGDYGEPKADTAFFKNHPEEESHYPIFISILTNPTLEDVATLLVKKETSRWKAEERKILATDDIDELISFMKQGIDNLNTRVFLDKIVNQAEVAVAKILTELEQPESGKFAELAVRAIYESDIDCIDRLIELVKKPVPNAYTLSLLCLLLGLSDAEKAIKPLWDCYHFLKERYPDKTYVEGAFIGLFELCADESEFADPETDDDDYYDEDDDDDIFADLDRFASKHSLEEVTLNELQKLIETDKKIAAIELFREKTNVGLKEAKDAIEELESILMDTDFEDEDDEFDEADEYDEAEAAAQDTRIEAILGTKRLDVTKKTIKTYLTYLKQNITLPCELTGIEDFDWEERYVFGYGSKKEYEELKKTHPSYTDEYNLLSFQDDIDVDTGILVKVQRISDKKQFTLPLADLEATNEQSHNYQLLDDYSVWFVNYR